MFGLLALFVIVTLGKALVGGYPLAGLPNFGQFGPLALPYYVLPLWLAPAFVKLGEFAVAVVGMTLFLRRLSPSVASGILAGIVFATSGFTISWTNWPQTRVAVWRQIPDRFAGSGSWPTSGRSQTPAPAASLSPYVQHCSRGCRTTESDYDRSHPIPETSRIS